MPEIIDEKKEREVWEGWLDEEHGLKLKAIRNAVTDIYKESEIKFHDLPFYTPHGIQHCSAVENLIHRLIPEEKYKKLSLKERFYLLASAWLHDLGMLKNVYFTIYHNGEAGASHIRKLHHITTAKFIVEYWNTLKIEEQEKELLAKLCFFHRKGEDLNNCEEYFYVGNVGYRLRLLAAYLRLADALDICSDRTPSESYAVCLAYNIPDESKLHWIKSRIVSGIFLDQEEQKIYVQFKIPNKSNFADKILFDMAEEKLQSIIKIVINGLRSELNSVINVLVRGKITYYLDIVALYSKIILDVQMLTDLREIVINYDIMMAPSASKLLDIILIIVANLLGFSLKKGRPFKAIPSNLPKDYKNQLNKINDFLAILESDILLARPCHLGLRKIVERIKKIKQKKDIEEIVKDIDHLYQCHHLRRSAIRINAKNFFQSNFLNKHNNGIPPTDINNSVNSEMITAKHEVYENIKEEKEKAIHPINVLLYGYSELAVKALCGLRDALIEQKYPCIKESKEIYNSLIEQDQSDNIQIFICDGQPKTQTGITIRYIYHDASQYAFYLTERGFSNITIIPDIIAGTLMACIDIDFIIVGANGITDKKFRHSGGHLGLIKLARAISKKNNSKSKGSTKIILVTTTEKIGFKFSDKSSVGDIHHFVSDVEGFRMRRLPDCSQNREHIWMMKDRDLIQRLSETQIAFANPREDKVEISDIDYIITEINSEQLNCENGWIASDNWSNFIKKWKEKAKENSRTNGCTGLTIPLRSIASQ